MVYFIAAGVLALLTGLAFIFTPDLLRKLSEAGSRMVTNVDTKAFNYRLGVGITLLAASLLFFFVAYYIRVRG